MEIRRLLKGKKGMSINDIYPVVLTIAVVAILLAIILMVMTEWTDATNTEETTINNETVMNVTEVASTVTNHTICGFSNFAVIQAYNYSGAQVIDASYYDVDADEGTITISAAGGVTGWNNTHFNLTYDFNYGDDDCEAVESMIDDFTDFIPWIGIILLVIAAAIVLGIVINSFTGKGNRV